MSYLVLARKWRPRSFDTLVGQEHVVRALTHALTTQRLHHAWLFTGTRGVGKTTLSRILAKSLNCETGITATPCGKCRACTEIDSGRFVDYLELDAASNRGVDEMTQLLEQAVYSPTVGRFKVYMIDEVHMLTGHAFNAMLKTLEEPPAHVKFILATTDPQKIPVTVLSRCLQFNLKQMPPESIVGHLSHVLDAEQMPYETPALRLIGQAARGSMRDALSLTDQAIAFSAGNLTDEAVRSMLGTIDQRHLVRLLDALADGDGTAVLAVADELATRSLSYSGALGDLAVMLSQIAIAQRVATAAVADHPLGDDLIRLASRLNPDAVQLFYSIAVHSRAELALAPDEYAGFAMACVRMLAFSAEAGGATVPPGTSAIAPAAAKAVIAPAAAVAVAPVVAAAPAVAAAVAAPAPAPAPAPAASAPTVVAPSPAAVSTATAEPKTAAASVADDMPETVPTAAPTTVLPAVPGVADSAESGSVSLPTSSVEAETDESAPRVSDAASVAPEILAPAPVVSPAPSTGASSVPTANASRDAAPVPSDRASSSAIGAPDNSPPWDETPAAARAPVAATPAPTAATPGAPRAPAAPNAPATPADQTDAPVNSPRAAMARALAGGPISGRTASAAGQSPAPPRPPAGGQSSAPSRPTASAAPARAPAPAAPPPRQARASGPPDLEPPPWLMDDAEPSFAAPPQGRRDAASMQSTAPASQQAPVRQPQASPVREAQSAPVRQAQAPTPSYPQSSSRAQPQGDPRDNDGSGFAGSNEGNSYADNQANSLDSNHANDQDNDQDSDQDNDDFESPPIAAASSPAYTSEPGAPLQLNESWPSLAARLPVRGIAAQLARQSELVRVDGNVFVLRVSARTLAEGQGAERLRSVLEAHFGQPVRVSVEVGATGSDTAHAVEQSVRSARQQAAEEAILADPFVRTLLDNFGGQIVPNSISPVSPEHPVKETPK